MMADGFLSRWSRRKLSKVDETIEPSKEQAELTPAPQVAAPSAENTPPAVTLEDVDKIDRFAPDFSAFMQADVDPAVQQAALKKMFTDPHFNVMDGLDIYIDDYSKPDPMPKGMLERMVQSYLLGLFRKNTDGLAEDDKSLGSRSAAQDAPRTTLEAPAQTDLTSTALPSEGQSGELNATPIVSDKQKT
jgi:hypothetical protein